MTTLADLTRQTARLITRMVIGTTTSAPSNATDIIDTVNLAGYPDSQFVGGTAWITSGLNAGRSRAITAFANATDKITCAAFPSNIASGVTFEAAPADMVTYQDLRQAVNLALREIGKIRSKDETLTVVQDQLIYTLPSGVYNVRAVEVVENVGDVDEEEKVINNHWDELDGKLVFEQYREPQLDTDTIIRVWYEKFHTELTADTDTLSEQVDEMYLVYLSARQAMRLSYKRFGKAGSETIPEWLNEAITEVQKHIKPNRHSASVRIRTA